jgi:hypothetical protein
MASILAYKDRLAGATLSTSVTGGCVLSVPGGFPLANLQNAPLKFRAGLQWTNAGGAASFTLRMSGGATGGMIAAALIGCISVNSGAGITSVTAQPLNGVANTGSPVAITLSTQQAYSADVDMIPHNLPFDFGGLVANANGVDFTFAVGAATSGTIYIGRAVGMTGLRFASGVDADWKIAYDDSSTVRWGRRGVASTRDGTRFRRVTGSVGIVHEDVAIGDPDVAGPATERTLADLLAYVGVSRDVLVIVRSSKNTWAQRTCVLGKITKTQDLEHKRGPNYELRALEIREGR